MDEDIANEQLQMQETLNKCFESKKCKVTLNQVKTGKQKCSKIATIVPIVQNIIEKGLTHQKMTLNA